MAATAVHMNPNSNGHSGTLFEGKRFWLSLNVPQRDRLKDLIKDHGGAVVLQEKHADIKLVDHTKRDIPLNTYSYTYIEESIQNGRLVDLEAHRAGKTTRPVGASGIPARKHRKPYTLQDDQILWDWVQSYKESGGQIAGNNIYQELAKIHDQHTWQSYRDRYLKRLRDKPRPGGPRQTNQQEEAVAQMGNPPERESLQMNSSQPSGIRGVQFDPIPRTPESAVRRTASSQHTPRGVSNANYPTETRDYGTTEVIRQPARSNLKVIKRKRLSDEGASAVPRFDVDNKTKRKRRATDFIPRADPSTPHQARDAAVREEQNTQNLSSQGTDSARFETAPQFSPSSTQSLSQSHAISASQNEDEANFNALLELPFPTGSSVLETNDEEGADDDDEVDHDGGVDEWIEERIRDGKKGEHVILALDRTSMNAELADRVLAFLSAGNGVPQNIPGVWTEEDDEALEAPETKKIETLLQKHGSENYNERFKYLEERRKAYEVVMREG